MSVLDEILAPDLCGHDPSAGTALQVVTVIRDELSAVAASDALAALGIALPPTELTIIPRDGRWLVRSSTGLIAWFAGNDEGRSAMRTERDVLRVLATRCPDVRTPRLLAESPDGMVDVRKSVPGDHNPDAVYDRLRDDPRAAAKVGATLGALIAQWHDAVRASDLRASLPDAPRWPESHTSIRERLPRVVDDPALHAAADTIMARYRNTLDTTDPADRALVHTDLGLHNVGIDAHTLTVHGVFDWESACWADRHLDFRYLTFTDRHDALPDAAIDAYTAATGRQLSRARIRLHNAACAIGYLASRDGVPPHAVWCGRTLMEDLEWTRAAITLASARTIT